MVTLNSNIVTAPGVYVSENTVGIIPEDLASFNRAYALITGAQGAYNTPTQVGSIDDLTNQFGISPTLESVRMFFRNYSNGILNVVRVGAPGRVDIQLATAGAGNWTVTINAQASTYNAQAGDNLAAIVTGVVNAINNNSAVNTSVTATAGTNGLLQIETKTIGGNFTLGALSAPGGSTITAGYYQYGVILGVANNGNWTLTINGTTITYVAGGGPTLSTIVQGLADAVRANATTHALVIIETITGTGFNIRARTGTLLTISGTAPGGSTNTLTPSVAAPALNQFLYAIDNAFDPDLMPQGFLIAPEAFSTWTEQSDRTSLALAMEQRCSAESFDWMALVDSGPVAAIDTLAKAQTEGQLYTTARGHLAYFYPYLTSLESITVPPSAAIAAIALRRYADQGFNQPPAGAQYPVRGVTDVVLRVTKSQQAVVNPLGINIIRYFPNQGTIVWGSRTRSSNPYYRFINVRIILNVLIGTLRTAFDTQIFTAVDGQGVLFTRIRETAAAICWRLWNGGALFGATPGEAFFCKCDRENNPDLDLEQGIVRLDVYVVPSPTMERLLISVNRTAIGQIEVVTRNLGA